MRHLHNNRYIVYLFCVIVVIQVLCISSCRSKNPNDNPPEVIPPSGEESTLRENDNEQIDHTDENPTDKFLVRFLTSEGVPVSIVEYSKGEKLILPTPPRQIGYVFTGWNGDYSNVSQDVDIIATYVDVSQTTNAISADTVYAASASEFDVIVGIYGDVNFCGLEMDIAYDSNLLDLIGVSDVDDCVILNDSTQGIIHMNYVTTSNTTGEVAFMTLKFQSKSGTKAETDLQVQVNSIYVLGSDDSLIQAEHQVISNKIVIVEVKDET